jgi:hypothetical protein
MNPARVLRLLPGRFAVCRFAADAPLPAWLFHQEARWWSITRTAHELSVVCDEDDLPPSVTRVERGWRCFELEGPIPFATTGVIAGLAAPLAAAGVPVFVISTFDTDYLLVKDADLDRARAALRQTVTLKD